MTVNASAASSPVTAERVRRAGELIVRHEGLALTLGYLTLVLLGMFHSVVFFWEFNVNVVEFAEVSDFVLAPVRDPFVILVSILPLLLLWGYGVLSKRLVRRWPRLRSWEAKLPGLQRKGLTRATWAIALVLWVVAFNLRYVAIVTDRIKAGHGKAVAATFADGSPIGGTADSPLLLLRGTSKFEFFYRPRERQVVIVPIESLGRIVIQRPPRELPLLKTWLSDPGTSRIPVS